MAAVPPEIRVARVHVAAWRAAYRGLAPCTLDGAVDELCEVGHLEAPLWMLRGNTRARRFHERMGWAPDGGERERKSERLPTPAVRYVRAP